MKFLKRLVLLVILLAIIAAVALYFYSGTLLKKGTEVGATAALGVDTTLDSASLSLFSGRVALNGLEVDNAEGYEAENLMSLGKIDVAVNVKSLMSDEIIVDHIILEQPELNFEFKGIKSNLSTILDNLNKGGGEAKPEKPAETGGEAKAGVEKTFVVKLIRITGAKVKVSSTLTGGKGAPILLPDIEMTDVSNKDGSPLKFADIVSLIFGTLSKTVVENVTDLPADVAGALKGAAGGLLDTATDLPGKVLKDAGGLGGKLKGLLGGDDD